MMTKTNLLVAILIWSWCWPFTVTGQQPVDDGTTERIGRLPILDVERFLRVDRQTRPDRQSARNSAFITRTQPHPVRGHRYVILTDHRQTAFLAPLRRLAKHRKGKVLSVDNLAVLSTDASQRDSLRQRLQQEQVRFLAIAPRLESFRENTLLAIWEVTSQFDDDPQLDVFPGVLLASDAMSLSRLVERSVAYRPQTREELRPLAISQVPTASELRSLQKAAVLRKWFKRWQLDTPIVAIYGKRAEDAAELSGERIWNLRAAPGQRFVRRFPETVNQALHQSSLVVMHGHGVPGMSCGVDVAALPQDLQGKLMLSGSCFGVSPPASDLALGHVDVLLPIA